MYKIPVYESDTAAELSQRAGCPVCMLLRANGVTSTAWLKTLGTAVVPENFNCAFSAHPCPRALARAEIIEKNGYIVRDGDSASSIAERFLLPERLVRAVAAQGGLLSGKGIFLPVRTDDMHLHTVTVGETWQSFQNPETLMLLNGCFGPLYPGMKILVIRR